MLPGSVFFLPLAVAATIAMQPLSFGELSAPVRLTMFLDYGDPLSARFWDTTYPVLKSEFIDKGEMMLEIRHYPLGIHTGAFRAALTVECARKQDEALAKKLHERYVRSVEPKGTGDAWVDGGVLAVAGLDAMLLQECVASQDMIATINQDSATAKDGHGFDVVPSFFLQSKDGASSTIIGAKSHTDFIAAINALLSEKSFALHQSNFSDVTSDHPYGTAIEYVRSNGIVGGYEDGTYRPDQRINRAEFLKIVLQAGNIEVTSQTTGCLYGDVDLRAWYAPYLCSATRLKIVEGDAVQGQRPTFRPADSINLAEALKIVSNTLAPLEEVSNEGGAWYMPYVRAFAEARLLPLTVTGPDQSLTRGEMADIIYRLSLSPQNREQGVSLEEVME